MAPLLWSLWISGCAREHTCTRYGIIDVEIVTNGTSVTCECLGAGAARCIAYQTDGVCLAERECPVFEDGGFVVQDRPVSQAAFDALVEGCSSDTGVGPTEMETWEEGWCRWFYP